MITFIPIMIAVIITIAALLFTVQGIRIIASDGTTEGKITGIATIALSLAMLVLAFVALTSEDALIDFLRNAKRITVG